MKIYTDKNIWKSKARKVYVTIENLTLLKASSGSNVKSESVINTNEIYIDASSGASIDIEVVAKSAVTEASSGSDVKIKGTTINHTARASSGSSINAYKLKSTNANASASSGASINIYASKNMDAKASSGGVIDYTGNPTKISKEASSGGSISIN